MRQRVFGITGWKNSGKTTLTEMLVTELCRRGWIVSTVKHAHHDFDIDREGTDSFRHRAAGATEVAIVSHRRWALMHELRGEQEPSLDAVLARLAPCDVVLVEGYKREPHKKIETRRLGAKDSTPLSAADSNIIAIASDYLLSDEVLPTFDLNNIHSIADFVEVTTGLSANARLIG